VDLEEAAVRPRGIIVRPRQGRHVQAQPSQPDAASLADIGDRVDEDKQGSVVDPQSEEEVEDESEFDLGNSRSGRTFDPSATQQPSQPSPSADADGANEVNTDSNGADDEGPNLADLDGHGEAHAALGLHHDTAVATQEDASHHGEAHAALGLHHETAVATQEAASHDSSYHAGAGYVEQPIIEKKDLFKATAATGSELNQAAESITTKIRSVDRAVDKVHNAMKTYHESIDGLSTSFGGLRSRATDMKVGLDGEFEERERQRLCSFENVERVMRGEAYVPCDKTTRLATNNGVHGDAHADAGEVSKEDGVAHEPPGHEPSLDHEERSSEGRAVSQDGGHDDKLSDDHAGRAASEEAIAASSASASANLLQEGVGEGGDADASEQAMDSIQAPASSESANANRQSSEDSYEGDGQTDGHEGSSASLFDMPSPAHGESPLLEIPGSSQSSLLEIPSSAEAQDQQDELDAERPEWEPETSVRQQDVLW